MVKKSRAKFTCEKVDIYSDDGIARDVFLSAVTTDDNPENKTFNKYTPAGELKIMVDNPDLVDFFQEGKDYYLDFTPVEEEKEDLKTDPA